MLLVAHSGGSDWLVHDWNSGGGLTRIHVRSVKGFSFVSPTKEAMPERARLYAGEYLAAKTRPAKSQRRMEAQRRSISQMSAMLAPRSQLLEIH
jgi:hypothetical protein